MDDDWYSGWCANCKAELPAGELLFCCAQCDREFMSRHGQEIVYASPIVPSMKRMGLWNRLSTWLRGQ